MSAVKLGLISVVIGLVGCAFVWLTPSWFTPAASVQADRHDTLYTALMLVSAVILGLVVTFLVYMVWKFRVRPGEELLDGPPIHGNTKLEIVWTLIPLAIVIGFAGYGAIVLHDNEAVASDHVVVGVTARQFAWSFDYEGGKVKSPVLVLPKGRQTEFHVTSLIHDVIHSFYVPEFRIQANAVPGHITRTWVTPTKLGTYQVICLELCGIGHAQMRAVVRVVSQQDFDTWLAQQQGAVDPLGNRNDDPDPNQSNQGGA
jgi:cytochrome c oxidase subunit 2